MTMMMIHPDSKQQIEVAPEHARRYLDNGWRERAADAPKGNAPLADWQDYARSKGFTEDDLEGQTRAQLRAALA